MNVASAPWQKIRDPSPLYRAVSLGLGKRGVERLMPVSPAFKKSKRQYNRHKRPELPYQDGTRAATFTIQGTEGFLATTSDSIVRTPYYNRHPVGHTIRLVIIAPLVGFGPLTSLPLEKTPKKRGGSATGPSVRGPAVSHAMVVFVRTSPVSVLHLSSCRKNPWSLKRTDPTSPLVLCRPAPSLNTWGLVGWSERSHSPLPTRLVQGPQ